MHRHSIESWQHDHVFGQDQPQEGERRTKWVIALTATTMVVEIICGIMFGSMALLADGLHMASHTAALGIAAFAYSYARRNAANPAFSFGTGKINSLAGFTGAILLLGFALLMAWESVERFWNPVGIEFNSAIFVAIIGLLVNGASVFLLSTGGNSGHSHSHSHDHSHDHSHGFENKDHSHHDHNLRSAYLHVLADALTSILAISALLAGKYLGWNWMDPCMGILGAILVTSWAWGLIRQSSKVLLDYEAPREISQAIREKIESVHDNQICDLHVWAIGPGKYSVALALVTHHPRDARHYKELIPDHLGVVHSTIEINVCSGNTNPEKC